jgi:hypothetical protein
MGCETAMIRAQAPDTVTEALEFLAAEGYTEEFSFSAVEALHSATSRSGWRPTATVDYTFRFEGPSDPADEAIVLGVRWSESNRKGVVVSAFGPDADPEHAMLLVELARH